MRTFYQLLANGLVVATKNNFVWFALTYFAYLETKSVIATGVVGGIFLVASALSSFWIGSIVDNYKKKYAMIGANLATLILFVCGFVIYTTSPTSAFTSVSSPILWIFALILLLGVLAGSIYQIAIPTLVTILVPENMHDKANGMFGTIFGISFAITSVASGLVLGFAGMYWVLVIAIILTILSTLHLSTIHIPDIHIPEVMEEQTTAKNVIDELNEAKLVNISPNSNITSDADAKKIDIKGTIKVIKGIPGLFHLILLTTFNNLLGGVFMALMDAYGLTLVSVQVWGLLWGGLSFGFIFGGLYISRKGLGDNPLANLFKVYIVLWTSTIFFTIQPSIILLAIGALVWMSFVPFIEATEQTIIQKVVPPERQGRVFGFAHSVEQAASPLTAFLIGPVAQYIFIPFMTTGSGVNLIGDWFGVGEGRGIALVFITTGLVGLVATLIAKDAKAYKLLAKRYLE